MLATSSSGVFAAQSEPQGDYNSLKLNVVNEVQNEITPAAEELEMFSIDAPAVMASGDNTAASGGAASGGASGGGGGGSTSIPTKVYDAEFEDYYQAADKSQYIQINWSSETAQKIIEANIDNVERADFAFYNQSNELVNIINDVEISNFYNYQYRGYINFNMNFVGFEPGDYDAEIILYNEAGVSFDLGKAALSITDKTILSGVQIINSMNGWSELAQTTEYFYVSAWINAIFVDVDKIDMCLLNSGGEEVAKTSSKDISRVYNYGSGGGETRLIYRLKVTQPLSTSENYTLDIRTAPELELVTHSDYVYIYVSGQPMASASMDKNFKVSLYTENIAPGEYVAAYWNNGEQDLYNITIDNQGKGSFNFIPPTEPEYYYNFELLTKEDNSHICKFEFYNENYNEYYYDGYTIPSFLSPAVRVVNNFEAEFQSELKEITTESIESIEVTQDDEVVATLNNWELTDSWTVNYKGANDYVEGSGGRICGNLTVLDGKSLEAGTEVVMVVTFSDGSACRMWIPVADATTGVRGEFEVDNYVYYWQDTPDGYVSYAVGSAKPSFTIEDTNITSGEVVLYCDSDDNIIETLDVSSLSKTTQYGYAHTYKGTFTTALEEGKIYSISVEANDDLLYFGNFIYYKGKMATNNSNLTVSDGYGYVYLQEFINISNLNNVSFKVVSGKDKQVYPVTSKLDSTSGNWADYSLDFSGVPAGYFTLKAYEGNTEINLREYTTGYNYGNTDKVMANGTGTVRVNGERYQAVFGTNLDKVQKAEIKLYKEVTGESSKDFEKLVYVKDAELAKPYNKNYITISPQILSGMETGDYTVIYIFDGEPVEVDNIYIQGIAPAYSAKIELNGGNDSTNESEVELKVSAAGYTKMRYAFSEEALEDAEYQAIVSLQTISLEGNEGEVTVYVQFANADETQTVIVTDEITVDTLAPVLSADELTKTVKVFESTEYVITTNEPLRNAFLVVKGEESDRTYVFSYVSVSSGTYTYKCSLYADSRYIGFAAKDIEIFAYDKAGNKSEVLDGVLNIISPVDVYGQVTYNGNAVANTSVYLYKDGNCVAVDYTDGNGEYIFGNIFAGEYEIKVNKRGFEEATLTLLTNDFENGDITGKDIALTSTYSQTADIKVTVTDFGGTPVEGAYTDVYSYDAGVQLFAQTDANGIATINVPYQTTGTGYRVYVNYGEYSDYSWITVNGNEEVNFSVPQVGTISGVAQRGDTTVANVNLTISGSGYQTYAVTDENGAFEAKVFLDGNRTFTVTANNNSEYSGSADVTFEENATTANVTLALKGNIKLMGAIKDTQLQSVTAFSSLYISGSGKYVTVSVNEDGTFETPSVFGAGSYYVSGYGWPYKEIYQTFTITEEDLASPVKELNLTAEKHYAETLFTTGYNEITANATTVAVGDKVTVIVKFQNDGTTTLSDVTAYAELPQNLTVADTSGTQNGQKIETTVAQLNPKDTGSLTFTLDTSAYTESTIVIPAYVKVGSKLYPLGAIAIEVVNATLSAPQVAKENIPFKVSGEAIADSTVEILDYATKAVLATTHTNSRWFFAELPGLADDTVLIAKVTKDGKVGYSEPVTVKVEAEPIAINTIKITHSAYEYANNDYFGYPTFSTSVGGDLRGGNIGVEVKFDNMPADAQVTYSFANKKGVSTKFENDFYKGTIKNWRGSGTKKIIATVKVGEEEYEFIVAEVIILIDPSGYITNAETGKPIEGATVLIEEKVGDEWVAWDAQPHKQQNPMLTDESGHYGWDVPEGTYRIIVSKEGFETKIVETYDSRDYGAGSAITVLPVRTDVDIAIGYALPIELKADEAVSVAGGRVKFEFTRPADPQDITSENFKVLDAAGNEVAGSLVLAEDNTVVLFKPAQAMAEGSYKISVANIKDNSGNIIPTEEIDFTKTADHTALAAPTVTFADGVITITFAEALANAEGISVKKNGAVVSGVMKKEGNVVTFAPDASLADGIYTVEISDEVRTADDKYIAAAVVRNVAVGTVPYNPPAGGGGGGAVSTITVNFETNGGNAISSVSVNKNAQMKSVPTPVKEGYKFVGWYTDKALTVKFDSSQKITKAMTLYAKWEAQEKTDDKTEQPSSTLFADVAQNAWYYEAVKYVKENGLFGGVSATEFAPNVALTRAMLVTVLYRAEGEPEVEGESKFTDVADGQYYAKAVAWAQSNNIVNGISDTEFAPDANITREQMAAIIYRYASFKGAAEISDAALDYSDLSDISEWAESAVAFCKTKNIMTGKDNNEFKPLDKATRAEAATILQRYFTNK